MKIVLLTAVTLLTAVVFSLAAGPVSDLANTPKQPLGVTTARGELEVFPLTNEYLVVAGLYDDFFNRAITQGYRNRLTLADRLFQQKELPEWSYRFFYNFATVDILNDYLPQIRKNFQDKAYFTVSVNGRGIELDKLGYWINAVGCKRTPYVSGGGTALTTSAELVPFAYLKFARPLADGDQLAITTKAGEEIKFTYDSRQTVSRAIKVNQVSYAPQAGQKYAYLGMWLAELGPLPLAAYLGKEFYVCDESSGKTVFTGKLAKRSDLQSITKNQQTILLDGEEVLEMDFSGFNRPGNYYITIPGVGRSWGFVIGDDAVGRAFYVQMRGLFHQRSGIAKEPKYTQWPMKADHMVSYRGNFAPNDRHYGEKGLMLGKDGKPVNFRHFELVKATATDEVLKNVYGGWWDAGDFDRRTYHFEVVDALLSVYLLFPDHFSDNQLDIPESGNNIPDIIDEAAWGVDVWRRAQNPAGGVGCWLEATSHPENPDPEQDTQRYYLAAPTRESTLEYSIYAAKLARAYQKAGAKDKAELFFASAQKAWDYANNPANQVKISADIPKVGKITYTEPVELPAENFLKAALNLYLYQRNERYAQILDKADFKAALARAKEAKSAYFLSELIEETIPYSGMVSQYKQMIRKRADELVQSQNVLAYRVINWPLDSPYFLFLGWGAGLPFQKGSYLIMAWRITDSETYRDAAYLCFDWMMGANPMGRSMTTGLGKVYPVRLLSLPMWAWRDRLVDPIPGITPYTFSGLNNYSAANMIYSLNFKERPDHNFKGLSTNLLPDSLCKEPTISTADCYKIIQQQIPVWRRFANVEGYAVNQNEFSVWETMAPAAAGYGALLTPGWKPPSTWKEQKPEPDIKKLPGYIFLP